MTKRFIGMPEASSPRYPSAWIGEPDFDTSLCRSIAGTTTRTERTTCSSDEIVLARAPLVRLAQ